MCPEGHSLMLSDTTVTQSQGNRDISTSKVAIFLIITGSKTFDKDLAVQTSIIFYIKGLKTKILKSYLARWETMDIKTYIHTEEKGAAVHPTSVKLVGKIAANLTGTKNTPL